MLMRDTCIGRTYLKFDGAHQETGSITNWLTLKDSENQSESAQETGQIFVSVTKELKIPPKKAVNEASSDARAPQIQERDGLVTTEAVNAV